MDLFYYKIHEAMYSINKLLNQTDTWYACMFPVDKNVSAIQQRTAVSNSRNMTSRRRLSSSSTSCGSVGSDRFWICFWMSRSSEPKSLVCNDKTKWLKTRRSRWCAGNHRLLKIFCTLPSGKLPSDCQKIAKNLTFFF